MAREFEIFYPNVYDEHDKKIIDAGYADAANPKPSPMGPAPADKEKMIAHAKIWAPYNPLYWDEEYAKNTRWGGLIAYPAFTEPGGMGIMLRGDLGLDYRGMAEGEKIIGNGMDHEIFYYKPIRPGDTFTVKPVRAEMKDITPAQGSTVRCIWSSSENEMYNQNGELVARQIGRMASNFKRYKNPGDRIPGEQPKKNMSQWRACHNYTEEDYDKIREYWANEKVRGAEPLYWEDVNVGDEPAPTCDGPITTIEMIRLHGQTVLDSAPMRDRIAKKQTQMLDRDDYGMYYINWAQHYCDRNIPGSRPVYYNTTARNQALRMITNWCGDDGFVSKVAWRLVYECPEPFNVFPEEWDRPSYLFEVPYLKEAGKFMNAHGLVGDVSISKGYVTKKYIDDAGNHCVDLVSWVENMDGDILQELAFTVQLPSRND